METNNNAITIPLIFSRIDIEVNLDTIINKANKNKINREILSHLVGVYRSLTPKYHFK